MAGATSATSPTKPSQFIGTYNGNSFETAMGMRIYADGRFQWGLSVGALDLRAEGTWKQSGEVITLASVPTPVAPEFDWSALERRPEGPLVRVVWASTGEPFQYAKVSLFCANGRILGGQVLEEGWSPTAAECDVPAALQLREDIYDVVSQRYELGALGWQTGDTLRFEFRANDMGVADFTGTTGVLEDGILKLRGARWPLELRKLPPREPRP